MSRKLSKEEHINFTEALSKYVYISDNGRLDLEDFCVTLAACIYYDVTGYEESARPEKFHSLLIDLIKESTPDGMPEKWVQLQKIVDWTPDIGYRYPFKVRTCIHAAALVNLSGEWISHIGDYVLRIPRDRWATGYFGWAPEEWIFTHMFLSGFHDALYSLCKKLDIQRASNNEPSLFEALHLTRRDQVDFDQALKNLRHRDGVWNVTTLRIEKSIEDKYYLEAINLAENLISHLLYNLLLSRSPQNKDLNLHSLIQKSKTHFDDVDGAALIEKVDVWRKNRNIAVHKYVTSSIEDLAAGTEGLSIKAKETAVIGIGLVKEMLDWYRRAAVQFIPHNFARTKFDD